MMARLIAYCLCLLVFPTLGPSATLDSSALERELAGLSRSFDGRVGACVRDAKNFACTKGADHFSMQSVMKLLVGVAVLDAVDHHAWRLEEQITIRKQDLSLNVEPLADLVWDSGFRTTIGDLVRRAIIQSDSAATDFLIARLGGPPAVQQCLNRLNIKGIRLDRDERHLQTETVGLEWRAAFIDATVLDAARAAVPEASRERAFVAYTKDARDTSTPKGMVDFLYRLQDRRLLSESSTAFVLKSMEDCATFPDRLKAGLPPGWKVAHKTGTSGSWKGVTVATNDVGIIAVPDGTKLAVAVFVADSKATAAERSSIIAKVSAAASAHLR